MNADERKKEAEKLRQENPELHRVAFEKGTEMPFTGKYYNSKEKGVYKCAICGAELFSSDAKFDSGTGWPSFTEPVRQTQGKPANVELREDRSHGMTRTEVVCKNCGSHLGHVFDDGPGPESKRYCINSVCLDLSSQGGPAPGGEKKQ